MIRFVKLYFVFLQQSNLTNIIFYYQLGISIFVFLLENFFMKRSLSVFILSFVLLFSVTANDNLNKLTEQEIKTLLCQKWKLNFLEYKGNKKEIPSKVPASFLVFLPDGKLEEYEGKNKYSGTWSYNHATKTITTIDKDGTEKHTIVELGNELFIMNGKYKGFTFNMGFKKNN